MGRAEDLLATGLADQRVEREYFAPALSRYVEGAEHIALSRRTQLLMRAAGPCLGRLS